MWQFMSLDGRLLSVKQVYISLYRKVLVASVPHINYTIIFLFCILEIKSNFVMVSYQSN